MLKFWFEESVAEVDAGRILAAIDPGAAAGRTTRDGIPLEQILRDRPDVFRAYYEQFHGAANDRHSDAWATRVGGSTLEDYANYWYEQHGRWEGYGQSGGGGAAAPLEDGGFTLLPGVVETGRTTVEGHLISQILSERPDVFRAFFTEFYGPNNDHKSTAWVDRVGGVTPEDYANYWWETYGRVSGWKPGQASGGAGAPAADDGDAGPPSGGGALPLVVEYTADGVILRPAEPDDIIEDGVVVGRVSSEAAATAEPETPVTDEWPLALALVVHYREDGVDLLPARPGDIVVDGEVLVGQALADYLAGLF